MKPKVNQAEINAIIWSACDTFRGVVDPSMYKDYILTMLFVKYVSDVWKDHYDRYMEKYNGNMERVQRALDHERFIVPAESRFEKLYDNRNESNIGELINVALALLEDTNRGKLQGVFRNIDFNSAAGLGPEKEKRDRLKHLLNDFNNPKLDLRPSVIGQDNDLIGDAYEYLIARFASDAGKKGGEFYTPGDVAELLAQLLAPKPGDRIYDPTCGSGSLLLRLANQIPNNNFSLYGQELNGSTWALCKMNMFLHGRDNAHIEWGNTLKDPKFLENGTIMKFDVVAANPPFSLDKWGAEDAGTDPYNRYWRGIPPKSKGDFAFILHMIESAYEENGKVGVIVPHGVLFRGGSEGKIRKSIIENNLLEAVIGLPSNLFYGTGIPAAILLFNRGKKTEDTLFIDASKHFIAGKNQNTLGSKNIAKIVQAFRAFETVPKYAYRATLDEIKENDFNLNIPRYVDTFEEEEEIDIMAVQREIRDLESQLADVRKTMSGYLQELGLTEPE